MSSHGLFSGFQMWNSGRMAYRKYRGVSSLDHSQKMYPFRLSSPMTWTGSQYPGSRSLSGFSRSQIETVQLQLLALYPSTPPSLNDGRVAPFFGKKRAPP
jgi:hypothetical protein